MPMSRITYQLIINHRGRQIFFVKTAQWEWRVFPPMFVRLEDQQVFANKISRSRPNVNKEGVWE